MKSQCIVVAEVGINHNGSLDLAKDLIDAAHLAGCTFVKFQKRTIDLVYTKAELDKPRESPWGNINREQKEGLEFGKNEYDEINRYSMEKRIPWIASPWDPDSVEFLQQYDNRYTKIASAGVTDIELLEAVKATNRPVIMSTGMSDKQQVDIALGILGDQVEYLLACTSTYPTQVEEMNLSFMRTLKKEYPKKKIGFSNHSPGITFVVAAAAMGAEMVEFHITLDRAMYGSDQAASIEIPGVLRIAKTIRDMEKGWGDGQWKVWDTEKAIIPKLRREMKFNA